MKSELKNVIVNGKEYKVWSDYRTRKTYAEDDNGEIKAIRSNGYLSNELSIRKAIAIYFRLASFRK